MTKEDLYYIDHGDVWHRISGHPKRVCDGTAQLGIAYSEDTLFKAGSERSVLDWIQKTKGKDTGFEIEAVFFPVSEATINELNLCLMYTGRVAHILRNLEAIGIADPTLAERPKYPV